MFKFTKIGATLGPASESEQTIDQMIKAGMNFARLNFSHGTYQWHAETIRRVRAMAQKNGEPISVLQDLQGPRIRIGKMPEKGVVVKSGEEVFLDTKISEYAGEALPVDQSDLHKYLKTGERFLIDDGRVELKIKKIKGTKIIGEVVEGGLVLSHKGINLPDSKLKIPALSEKDKQDLRFGVKNGVDMVGLSFVSTAKDVRDLRSLIEKYLKEERIVLSQPILIISKIERHEAVDNLNEIIEASDGIMVARGDLGLELPLQEVPLIQKRIIDAARKAAKPVMVATQLLDSMRESRRPSRAEVSDVANAVIDHADSLLLTNETAAGRHPVEVIKTMVKIIETTEKSRYDDFPMPPLGVDLNTEQAVCKFARLLAEEVESTFILAASISGRTGRLISHVRPPMPTLVATNEELVYRQLSISWGIKPFLMPYTPHIEEFVEKSINYLKDSRMCKNGDKVVVVAGEPMGKSGNVNLVEIREIK